MANIFEGLEKFGIGVSKDDLYRDGEEEKKKAAAAAPPEAKEEDLLLERSYPCPVCEQEFKVKSVKNGKAKSLGADIDLRQKYDGVDMTKYDVIVCPTCGFAALTRYFKGMTPTQKKLVKEKISVDFKGLAHEGPIYTYEEAMERYQLALANAVVKGAKPSEKAFICMKSGWLVRGMREALDANAPDFATLTEKYNALEHEYLKNAMEGFVVARQKESYPMCGMDEFTVDYLVAALAIQIEKYDVASKLIANMLGNSMTPSRIKDKARDLKDLVLEKKKEQEGK
ncbi:MAG: DUF2225 domain-containing protein [Eubacteriales bacterium]